MSFSLPYVDNYELRTGQLVKAYTQCLNSSHKGKCRSFYEGLMGKADGFYSCPKGLSVFKGAIDGKPIVFSGFKEKGTYLKQKAVSIGKNDVVFNPLLDRDQVDSIIQNNIELHQKESVVTRKEKDLDSIIHEIKKLNAQVREHCELIWDELKNDDQRLDEIILSKFRSISVCANMMQSRFFIHEYENNPINHSKSASFECGVHKKFHKMRMILKDYMRKNVSIDFWGKTTYEFNALPTFEFVPFLVLENAIKYSPEGGSVSVKFVENGTSLQVSVVSEGPYCKEEDMKQIFNKGFRGSNVKDVFSGGGLGMYWVKAICDNHDINIKLRSFYDKGSGGASRSKFEVQLQFPRKE